MMYKVLYRKWRPRSFDDVVGQLHVTVTLTNEIKLGRIGQAYLFIGARGTGKTTCAKILAKAVNCLNPKEGNPCGECDICKGIDNGSIMDVVEMDAASNNSVNDIRALCEEVFFTPAIAKYRVYIIDEVHMLSPGAFNALLKTLEDPPKHVIFILATTEAHKIPATILSRCQRFEFHRISVEEISARLKFISFKEGVTISDEAAILISRLAEGGLRDALSILDKCVSVNNNVTSDVVIETAGLAPREHLLKLSEAIVKKEPAEALSIINDLNTKSKDMMLLCKELIEHFRNLMLFVTMENPRSILVMLDDEYKKFDAVSQKMTLYDIVNAIDVLELSMERILRGCERRVEIETAIIKLSSPKFNMSIEKLLKRVDQLEKIVADLKLPNKEKLDKNDLSNLNNVSQENISCVPADLLVLTENAKPLAQWPEILEVLKGYSQTIAMAFNSSNAYVSGDFILIDSKKDVAFEMLRKSVQRDKMRIAIKDVMGKFYKLGPYKKVDEKKKNCSDSLRKFADIAKETGVNVTIT